MKVLSKVLLIALLASIVGLSGCDRSQLSEVNKSAIPLPSIKPSNARNSVSVIFPQKANIKLVGGESRIGWVNINLQAKEIEVSLNSDSATISFSRIQKINFDLTRAIYSAADIVTQGEESSNVIRETFNSIPVSDLKLEKETSEVTVKLNNSASNQIFVVRVVIYVVEEILLYESSQKMTLKVLCCVAT